MSGHIAAHGGGLDDLATCRREEYVPLHADTLASRNRRTSRSLASWLADEADWPTDSGCGHPSCDPGQPCEVTAAINRHRVRSAL